MNVRTGWKPADTAGKMPASTILERPCPARTVFAVQDYDLTATFSSGQVFRWQPVANGWEGVIGTRWVRLRSTSTGIQAEKVQAGRDWGWLAEFLGVGVDLGAVLATFPDEEPMRVAVAACPGLRILRQDPWECLASFILSSSKQIVQIQQIVGLLCERFGETITVPAGHSRLFAFPSAARIAQCSELELRDCKMGFRAPYLRETARIVAAGGVDLAALSKLPLAEARAKLMEMPGVGRKIADCVLLFACGFDAAFPIDVWMQKCFTHLYFQGRTTNMKRLQEFAESHFGPHAGYAQQYLFHHARTKNQEPRTKNHEPLNCEPRTSLFSGGI